MSNKPMDRETAVWHEMYEKWESEKEAHALTRSTGSTSTCALEMKDGHVWRTITQMDCQEHEVDETLDWLSKFGDRQFSRHKKRRVRKTK